MNKIYNLIDSIRGFFIICGASVFMFAWISIEAKNWVGRYIIDPFVDLYIKVKKIK